MLQSTMSSLSKILFILSMMTLFYTAISVLVNKEFIIEWEIMKPMSMKVKVELMVEWSNILYSWIVLLILTNLMLFSNKYMELNKNSLCFGYMVMCFIMSMNMLIFIFNMVILLIGRNGLGIILFILTVYYNNWQSDSAGMLTMMTNRFGDMFLIMSIVATLNMGDWSMVMGPTSNNFYSVQWLEILAAEMTKGAQMPYSTWLPAAMTALTLVSALVYLSSLVTAGMYFLCSLSNMVNKFNPMKVTTMISSILTMLLASMSTLYENDLKIIVLLMLNQFGLMVMPMSLNLLHVTMFYMLTRTLFKVYSSFHDNYIGGHATSTKNKIIHYNMYYLCLLIHTNNSTKTFKL